MTDEKIDARDPGDTQGHSGRMPVGADFIVPTLAMLLTLYYLGSTGDLAWEARSTGWLIGFALLALCILQFVLLAVRRLRGKVTLGLGELLENTLDNRKRLGLLVTLGLFVVTIRWTGATLGLFLVMILGMLVMGVRKPGQILAIAGCTAASVFLLFIVLLNSRLPQGALDHLLLLLTVGQRD